VDAEGASLASRLEVEGDRLRLVVDDSGAALHDDVGDDSGAAYVFVRSGTTWSQEAKLNADDGVPDDSDNCPLEANADQADLDEGDDGCDCRVGARSAASPGSVLLGLLVLGGLLIIRR